MRDEVERWSQQAKKGSTRLAILQLVSERERYGYELITTIRERTDGALEVAEGNVYPTLHALEKAGHITSAWREVEPGVPPRKYYRLTDRGEELLDGLVEAWRSHAAAVSRLIDGGERDAPRGE